MGTQSLYLPISQDVTGSSEKNGANPCFLAPRARNMQIGNAARGRNGHPHKSSSWTRGPKEKGYIMAATVDTIHADQTLRLVQPIPANRDEAIASIIVDLRQLPDELVVDVARTVHEWLPGLRETA